jgi:uncharacterized protein
MATMPTGCGLFLGNDEKVIAIFVDPYVASAIALSLQGLHAPRPLTHDLIANLLAGLDARVVRVVVNDLKDDTFYARITLQQESELGRKLIEVDARPSDSIALALHCGCPIYVAESVWESSEDMTWAMEQAARREEGDDAEGFAP